ncbi:MAG TPA: SRPBCC family protein, partial [Polyangiaceae bacterium]|nr:SRPBCC family protein [Polyangiaceae bacterium]
ESAPVPCPLESQHVPWRPMRRRRLFSLLALGMSASVPGCTPPAAVMSESAGRSVPDAASGLAPHVLSEADQRSLLTGGRVEEPVQLERGGHRYVGGVSYMLVQAPPNRVFQVLNELDTLARVLPATRSVQLMDRSGQRVRLQLEQGSGVVSTRFTLFFELEPSVDDFDPGLVRFWLDPAEPHGIDDVWGFFRATSYDSEHSLVAVGVLVDLGPGLVRMLFEDRIQRSILRMPKRIRDTVEARKVARGRATP